MRRDYLIGLASNEVLRRDQLSNLRLSLEAVLDTVPGRHRRAVCLIIRDRFKAACWLSAALLCDCLVVPLNPALPATQLQSLVAHSNPGVLISDVDIPNNAGRMLVNPDELRRWSDEPPTSAEGNLSWLIRGDLLIYTSGTTGVPKGVRLTCGNLRANSETAVSAFGYDGDWVTASVLPLFHTFTIINDLLTMLSVGGTCVVCPVPDVGTLDAVLQAFTRFGVRSYSAVPILLRLLARFGAASELESLRFAISGAAPLSGELAAAYERELGHPVLPCYGMTEATCFITIPSRGKTPDGSVGCPAGLELRILSEEGLPLPVSQRGEIAIRGPSVIQNGYFELPDSPSGLYRQGFLLTGDIGHIDHHGNVFITGRRKNMMIKGGEKIYLEDIDQLALAIPAVSDAASLVIPEPNSDDEAACFLAVSEDRAARATESLTNRVRSELGLKAVPRYVHCVDQIPRSPTGKPILAELRRLHASRVPERARQEVGQ